MGSSTCRSRPVRETGRPVRPCGGALGAALARGRALRRAPRLLRVRPTCPVPGEPFAGGTSKFQKLAERFPNRPADFTPALPRLERVAARPRPAARIARRRGARSCVNQDGVGYPGWAGDRARTTSTVRCAGRSSPPTTSSTRPRSASGPPTSSSASRPDAGRSSRTPSTSSGSRPPPSRPPTVPCSCSAVTRRRRTGSSSACGRCAALLPIASRRRRCSSTGRIVVGPGAARSPSSGLRGTVELVGRYAQSEAPGALPPRAPAPAHEGQRPVPERRARGDGVGPAGRLPGERRHDRAGRRRGGHRRAPPRLASSGTSPPAPEAMADAVSAGSWPIWPRSARPRGAAPSSDSRSRPGSTVTPRSSRRSLGAQRCARRRGPPDSPVTRPRSVRAWKRARSRVAVRERDEHAAESGARASGHTRLRRVAMLAEQVADRSAVPTTDRATLVGRAGAQWMHDDDRRVVLDARARDRSVRRGSRCPRRTTRRFPTRARALVERPDPFDDVCVAGRSTPSCRRARRCRGRAPAARPPSVGEAVARVVRRAPRQAVEARVRPANRSRNAFEEIARIRAVVVRKADEIGVDDREPGVTGAGESRGARTQSISSTVPWCARIGARTVVVVLVDDDDAEVAVGSWRASESSSASELRGPPERRDDQVEAERRRLGHRKRLSARPPYPRPVSSASPPLVSVLVAAHDAGRYLAAAVGSVLRQTVADLELVVVDDCSTDCDVGDPRRRSTTRGSSFSATTSQLGLAASLNRGLDTARGRYVARLDADDVALPRRLERQLARSGCGPRIWRSSARLWSRSTTTAGRAACTTRRRAPSRFGGSALFGSPFFHPTVLLDRETARSPRPSLRPGIPRERGLRPVVAPARGGLRETTSPSRSSCGASTLARRTRRRADLQRSFQRRVALREIGALAPALGEHEAELAWRVGAGLSVPGGSAPGAASAFLALARQLRAAGTAAVPTSRAAAARSLARSRVAQGSAHPRPAAAAARRRRPCSAAEPGLVPRTSRPPSAAASRLLASAGRGADPCRRRLSGADAVPVAALRPHRRSPGRRSHGRLRRPDRRRSYLERRAASPGGLPPGHRAPARVPARSPRRTRVTPGIWRGAAPGRPDAVVVSGWSTFAAQAALPWCRRRRVPYVLARREPRRGAAARVARAVKGAVVPRLVRGAASAPRRRDARAASRWSPAVRDPERVRVFANTIDVEGFGERADRLAGRRVRAAGGARVSASTTSPCSRSPARAREGARHCSSSAVARGRRSASRARARRGRAGARRGSRDSPRVRRVRARPRRRRPWEQDRRGLRRGRRLRAALRARDLGRRRQRGCGVRASARPLGPGRRGRRPAS